MQFRVVTGNTARNPVARAIARQKVHDRLMAAKLRIYLLGKGEDASDFLHGVMASLLVVGRALEIEYEGREHEMPDDVLRDTRVLRGGLSAMQQHFKKWDPAQAVAAEQGIDACERLNRVAKTQFIEQASRETGLLK